MLRKLDATGAIQTSPFGGFCPYWTELDGEVLLADTAEEIIQALPPSRRVLDPIAVFELLQFNYILGDRTLVQGVQRLPWRATLNGRGEVARDAPIPHGEERLPPEQVARRLRKLLEEELLAAVEGRRQVYLMLTGGLDSRIVAGVLKGIEPDVRAGISCVTWGAPDSRDVHYARQIAGWFGWEFIHVPYPKEAMWENIRRGAIWGGSEVTGLHLHRMDWFERASGEDLAIAASFGDSVGRAEYSSVHLQELSLPLFQNPWNLFPPSRVRAWLPQAEGDRARAWDGQPANPPWARIELDKQENYMRRMICHAMDYVRQYCNLHQAFTSPEVVSFMWSLAPACRTDQVYVQLLKDLDPRLAALPWARTGVAPDGSRETDPSLTKHYHAWGRWLREDYREQLEALVFSPGMLELGLFHLPALYRMWKAYLREPADVLWTAEDIVKIASLELTRRHFNLVYEGQPWSFTDRAWGAAQGLRAQAESLVWKLAGRG